MDSSYLAPRTAAELVDLCQNCEPIIRPQSKNILLLRKFWYVDRKCLELFPERPLNFREHGSKIVSDSLTGIASCYKFKIEKNKIEMFQSVTSDKAWKTYDVISK